MILVGRMTQSYSDARLASMQRLGQQATGQTLTATALVHEAYLRLVGSADVARWDHRGHFFGAAAEAMRRILVDSARRKRAEKHGGGKYRIALHSAVTAEALDPDSLLDLDEALTAFEAADPEKAALVRLRFFAGLSESEAAECLGLSRATASRHWTFARAWLLERLVGVED